MKKDEIYQISKLIDVLYHFKLSTNSLGMITQFLEMSIYKILMLSCENMLNKKLTKSHW